MTEPVQGRLRRLRATAAPLTKTALLRMGGYAAIRRVLPSQQVAILRYHAICGPEGYAYADPSICISPNGFERHAQYLAANYAVLPLPEVVERLRWRRPLPPNAVAITFDDGYADNLAAARVLKRYGLSATFYITAGCLDGEQPFWPCELRALVAAAREPILRLALHGSSIDLPVGNDEERQRAIRKLTRLFKSNPIPSRESLREQLRRAATYEIRPERCMLRWSELAEMHGMGMTIGAHTLTHPNLPSAGLEAATREIAESKARLERELAIPVTMFSYPNGGTEHYYTPELQRVVAEAGFAAAASSQNAFAGFESDLYALERIEVEERLEEIVFALEVERFAFRSTARITALDTVQKVGGTAPHGAGSLQSRFIDVNRRICKHYFQPRLYPISHMSAIDWWFERRANALTMRGALLELGSGRTFPLSKLLKERFERCEATDIDDIPRQFWPDGVHFRRCTTSTLPFDNNSFDLVVIRSVVEHVSDPDTFFREVSRVASPGGRVFVNIPNRWDYVSVAARLAGSMKSKLLRRIVNPSWDDFPVYYRCNTRRALRKVVRNTDLEIESIRPVPSEPAYLKFFVPFYLAGALYQFLVSILGLDFLQPTFVVEMRRRVANQ